MSPENNATISALKEEIGWLLRASVLLELETKAELQDHYKESTDSEELSRIASFLREEKHHIVAFLQHLLREDRIPLNVLDLMSDIRRDYRSRIAAMEAKEQQQIITESWLRVSLEYL